jgi:hypothetical protein
MAGAALFGLACSKSQPEGNAGAAGPAAAAGGAEAAAPAGAPDAKEQELLEQVKRAATADERRQIYAQLTRLHPENKQYKHELKRARREARQEKRAQARSAQGAEAAPTASAGASAH